MEISLEDRSFEEPEEFDYTLDDGMYSDCDYGDETRDETREEECLDSTSDNAVNDINTNN